MHDNALMPRKRKPPEEAPSPEKASRPADRHKPRRLVGIRERLAQGLEALAERNETDITEEANRAVREFLERHKLWPPPEDA